MAKAINLDHISTLWGKMKEYVSTAISGLYTKPTTGVPKTDLATDVQTSLGKADSALQSHQSLSNYYTKTEVNNLVNATGTSMPSGGFLPNVEYDLGTLSGATTFKLSSSTGKFFWTFNTGTTAPTITWSFTAKWANAPVINASKHYEVSVRNGYAYIQEFDI